MWRWTISPKPSDDERRTAAQHLEEDHAQRVDVGAVIDLARAAALLGRHVRGRSHHRSGPRPHRADVARRPGRAWRCRSRAPSPSPAVASRSSGTRKRLSGLRSRWTMPAAWAAASALAVCAAMRRASATGSRPRSRRRAARFSPSSSSITMYEVPDGSVPQSNTSTMPGWRIAFAARASLKKRFVSSGVVGQAGAQDLDRRAPPDPRVLGEVDHAHPALTDELGHAGSCRRSRRSCGPAIF